MESLVVEIDRKSPIPVYFQLAHLLERAIRQGEWKDGDRLPSELEICEQYALSRTTVRQAMSWLENQGLIFRRRGAGSFVQGERSRTWQLSSPGGFFEEEALRKGHEVTSEVLRAEIESLPAWATSLLRLPAENEGGTIERVRAVDGQQAVYVVNHVAREYADAALAFSDPNESLYLRLKRRTGVELTGGDRTVKATGASDALAEALKVEPGYPLLFIQSVSWDRFKTPVDCYRAWVVSEVAPLEVSVTSVPDET